MTSTAARFRTVLVANRSEIALRVISSLHHLGYRSVAVYSEADKHSPHVKAADSAVYLGDSAPAESYLNIDKLLEAAQRSGAEAIHPGYGFLAENAEFVNRVEQAGLVFVGPSSAVVQAMGNKAQARQLAQDIGLACVPGYHGADQSDPALLEAAKSIGLPLMIKAAAGGGGRGMRLVTEWAQLETALHSARSEALSAFGSAELIIERAVQQPRHIEIQVLADQHGNAVHLGERDCSVQRRHQKLIEEAPSPAVSPELRAEMGAAALAIVHHIGYVGAGTVEFLLDASGAFYFMEMNTRLQVEHAVTEEITGIDIVDWQFRIAAGEALAFEQADIKLQGHAIEVRLTAEDVQHDFLPQTGTVLAWQPDTSMTGIRLEHCLEVGQEISPFYDSMIAKCVATGRTRAEAIRKLIRSLENLVLLGVPTNQAFLLRCLAHEAFMSGQVTTQFIQTYQQQLLPAPHLSAELAVLSALVYLTQAQNTSTNSLTLGLTGLRSTIDLRVGEQELTISWLRDSHTGHISLYSKTDSEAEPLHWVLNEYDIQAQQISATLNGLSHTLCYVPQDEVLHVFDQGQTWQVARVFSSVDAQQQAYDGVLYAPMTGRVIEVLVTDQQVVEAGQVVAVIEAMKMEHSIIAEQAGVVTELSVSQGDQAHALQPLMKIMTPEVAHV